MVLDDRRQLPAVFFVWKSIDDSSEDGKDAAECERRWPVLGGWNCAKFPDELWHIPASYFISTGRGIGPYIGEESGVDKVVVGMESNGNTV